MIFQTINTKNNENRYFLDSSVLHQSIFTVYSDFYRVIYHYLFKRREKLKLVRTHVVQTGKKPEVKRGYRRF